MARETVTFITDDLDGSADAQTVLFAFDGKQYELDLGKKNRKRLAEALQPFIDKARPVGAASGRGRATKSTGNRNVGEIREWARANGHTVSERGRIPAAIADAYRAAH